MDKYGAFEEKGYRFESYVPSEKADPVEFKLRILINDAIVASFSIPMVYRPVFGVDVGDASTLEEVTECILQSLPEPTAFNDATRDQILAIVRRYDGSAWREGGIE